ncbi:MAG: hypothetical protein ISS27_02745 [Candidatus Omnitrophica bacterium]|nr:hypothetical protein [Candidatus Omnitrophota bacterium]
MNNTIGRDDFKSLQKRYLVWFYKVTREAIDKIERKFTQLEIDRLILNQIRKSDKDKNLISQLRDFDKYIRNKEQAGLSLKYEGKKLNPEYQFLLLKLGAIEKAIVSKMGKKGLVMVKTAYEEEMLKRIMEERQEKR